MRFMPRPNAPTYPDADHSATARPMISAKPAPWVWLSWFRVGSRVSAALEAPTSRRMSSSVSTVCLPWPTRPTSETIAIAAGNSASTE